MPNSFVKTLVDLKVALEFISWNFPFTGKAFWNIHHDETASLFAVRVQYAMRTKMKQQMCFPIHQYFVVQTHFLVKVAMSFWLKNSHHGAAGSQEDRTQYRIPFSTCSARVCSSASVAQHIVIIMYVDHSKEQLHGRINHHFRPTMVRPRSLQA